MFSLLPAATVAALALTKACKMSKATDCSPVDTLSASASNMETRVGMSRDSKELEQPGVMAMVLKMSSANEVRTGSTNDYKD